MSNERILLGTMLRNNNKTQITCVLGSTDPAHEHFYFINFMTMTLRRSVLDRQDVFGSAVQHMVLPKRAWNTRVRLKDKTHSESTKISSLLEVM